MQTPPLESTHQELSFAGADPGNSETGGRNSCGESATSRHRRDNLGGYGGIPQTKGGAPAPSAPPLNPPII